jgi:spore coat protein YsxE
MKIIDQPLSLEKKEELVLREYDFFPQKLENKGSVKKVVCDHGSYALKRVTVEDEQMKNLVECVRHLLDHQYPHILPLHLNKYGDSYVNMQDERYYVTPWIENIIEHKYLEDWETDILKALGEMHAITLDYKPRSLQIPLTTNVLLKRWQNRLVEMKEYKQFAENREIMSPLEIAFIAHYNYLQEHGLRAIRYLKEWAKKTEGHDQRTVLCHGHVHRKHVLQNEEQFYFVHMEHVNIDSPARDLALFFRRHVDRITENEGIATRWLAAYEKKFPLERIEKLLFSIYLLFPEGAFKEIEIYYKGSRDWPPLKQVRYFERQINIIHLLRRFVKEMLD